MAHGFKRGLLIGGATGFVIGVGGSFLLVSAFTENAECIAKASLAQGAVSTKNLDSQGKTAVMDDSCNLRILDKSILENAPVVGF